MEVQKRESKGINRRLFEQFSNNVQKIHLSNTKSSYRAEKVTDTMVINAQRTMNSIHSGI